MRLLTAAFVAVATLSAPVIAAAQTPVTNQTEAQAFLALYQGSWRGRGESRNGFDEAMENAQCNLDVVFNTAELTLTNDGRCASTQGGVDVDGTLTLNPDGTLSGGFFSRFERATLLSSSGRILTNQIVVEATYSAEIRRQVQELVVRVSIGKPGPAPDGTQAFGMIVEVRDPSTGEFVNFTNMVFTPRT
ncbi:MAG: hypothetical protein AB7O56_09955 [Bauldia sp.]